MITPQFTLTYDIRDAGWASKVFEFFDTEAQVNDRIGIIEENNDRLGQQITNIEARPFQPIDVIHLSDAHKDLKNEVLRNIFTKQLPITGY